MGEKSYPLVFRYRDAVHGKGFVAEVSARGRALMVEEGDQGWWLYGVQPGGMAEHADSPVEAHARFRRAFTAVLFDFAAEADNFETFDQAVRRFLSDADETDASAWDDARAALRAGAAVAEAPFDTLPIDTSDEGPFSFEIVRLDEVRARNSSPSQNKLDEVLIAAA